MDAAEIENLLNLIKRSWINLAGSNEALRRVMETGWNHVITELILVFRQAALSGQSLEEICLGNPIPFAFIIGAIVGYLVASSQRID